jgi:hypothetical protein
MWKLEPEVADSIDDSTEGKGCRSDISGGGGVNVCCSGDAWNEWNCEAMKGGSDVRFIMCGDMCGGDPGT